MSHHAITPTPEDTAAGVSVIVATTGRRDLLNTLEAMRFSGIQARDEVLVILDGSMPAQMAKRVRATAYHLEGRTGTTVHIKAATGPWTIEEAGQLGIRRSDDWGAKARTRGLELASKPWVAFMDDDDIHAPGALSAMRGALRAEEAREGGPALVLSRMMSVGQSSIGIGATLWSSRQLRVGQVGTPMLWAPRWWVEERGEELPAWPSRYEGDLLWARAVVDQLHELGGPDLPTWVPHVTALIRPWAYREGGPS